LHKKAKCFIFGELNKKSEIKMKKRNTKFKFPCDVCSSQKAEYDAKMKTGPWAYMCSECFKIYGIGLGLGMGQKLIYKNEGET
jgi:late competence protein required for DNA uptake (superfamily II DNA/RNA helicase)